MNDMFNFLKKVTGRKSKGGNESEGEVKKDNGSEKSGGDNELLNHAESDDEFQRHEGDEDLENRNNATNIVGTPFVKDDLRSAMEGTIFSSLPYRVLL